MSLSKLQERSTREDLPSLQTRVVEPASERIARQNKESLERQRQTRLDRQREEGSIYDISTGRYNEDFNKQGTDERLANDGIDALGLEDRVSGGGGSLSYNTTVALVVNGTPYLMDISASTLYAVTEDPNFPVTEPT